MLYVLNLSIPANTPASVPVSAEIVLKLRSIEHGRIAFPAAAGLVGVRLLDRNGVFMPAPDSPSQWLIGISEPVEWNEDYELSGPPFRLVLEGYNTDATNAFTVRVQLEVTRWPVRSILRSLTQAFNVFTTTIVELVRPPSAEK